MKAPEGRGLSFIKSRNANKVDRQANGRVQGSVSLASRRLGDLKAVLFICVVYTNYLNKVGLGMTYSSKYWQPMTRRTLNFVTCNFQENICISDIVGNLHSLYSLMV